jgi:hypothetical protein
MMLFNIARVNEAVKEVQSGFRSRCRSAGAKILEPSQGQLPIHEEADGKKYYLTESNLHVVIPKDASKEEIVQKLTKAENDFMGKTRVVSTRGPWDCQLDETNMHFITTLGK